MIESDYSVGADRHGSTGQSESTLLPMLDRCRPHGRSVFCLTLPALAVEALNNIGRCASEAG